MRNAARGNRILQGKNLGAKIQQQSERFPSTSDDVFIFSCDSNSNDPKSRPLNDHVKRKIIKK